MAGTNSGEKLRYGISALDMAYKEDAEKDELLVRGHNGKMFYKRESDGQIVGYDTLEYDKESLISAINGAITKSKAVLETVESDYIAYHTLDLTEKNVVPSNTALAMNYSSKFKTSKTKGFFTRIRGTKNTNALISFIESLSTKDYTVKIDFEVTNIGGTVTTKTISANGKFNELMFVDLSVFTDNNITGYIIKVKSILIDVKSEYDSLSDEKKEALMSLNDGNTKIEASVIDLITYVNDMDNLIIHEDGERIGLEQLLSIASINSETVEVSPMVVSEDKPDHACVWAQIK